GGKDIVGCRVEVVQIGGADEPLQHRYMRLVIGIERETVWIHSEQASVYVTRPGGHDLVRLQHDIDRHNRVILLAGRNWIAHLASSSARTVRLNSTRHQRRQAEIGESRRG